MTASALGAGLIGLAAGLPAPAQLLLVASSPLLAGVLGTVLLTLRPARQETRQAPAAARSRRHEEAPGRWAAGGSG